MLDSGPKLVAQCDAATVRSMIGRGLVETCDHPDVKRPDGGPAQAVRLVDEPVRSTANWTINYVRRMVPAGKISIARAREFVAQFRDGLTMHELLGKTVAWSMRCDCHNGHNSNSGRCHGHDVWDPTRKPGAAAICEACRKSCQKVRP